MVKDFLIRGSASALSVFIPSLRPALLLGILLGYYGDGVQATIGLTSSYFSIALVATAGFTVSAVFALAKHLASPVADFADTLKTEFKIGAGAACVLGFGAVVAGIVLPLVIEVNAELFRAFWFASIGSLLLMPFASTLSGAFQARNRDRENLILSVIATVFLLAVALAVAITGVPAVPAVIIIGVSGVVTDIAALIYRTARLGDASRQVLSLILAGMREFVGAPISTILEFPGRTKGALDGLILMTVFTVAGTVAAQNSARDGAIVVMIIAVLRAFIIPLKQYGIVGGRLIKQREAQGDNPVAQLRTLLLVSLVLLLGIGLFIVALRLGTDLLDVIPLALIAAMVAQLALEPVTGFAFAAQKVLSSPSFGLRALAIISFFGTIPILILLPFAGFDTAYGVWITVLCARVVFFGVIAVKVIRWSSVSSALVT